VTGRRFTWIIVAGVGALLLFAGLDALRSSGESEVSATTAPGAAETTAESSTQPLLPCDVEKLTISIVRPIDILSGSEYVQRSAVA
jgi:hypothetical protein